jgi:hypothetical protein
VQNLKRLFGQAEGPPSAPVNPREIFDQARALATSASSQKVVMVRPDLSVLELACPAAESLPRNIIEHAESVLSSKLRRNVAVVTPTGFGTGTGKAEVGSAVWNEAGKKIPFFGILNSLACIGYSVWLFDVTSNIEAACRDSDVLIIDSEVDGSLTDERITAARRVMRGSSVLMHDRATYQLRRSLRRNPPAVDGLLSSTRPDSAPGGQFAERGRDRAYRTGLRCAE